MILTCENCDTSFNFDESLIKPSGSKVRCSKCRNVFVVHPPGEMAADVGAEDATDGLAAVAGPTALDDLDLATIEKSLDLDAEQSDETDAGADAAVSGDGDPDFDAADLAAAGDIGAMTADGITDDLNFDLDLDALTEDEDTVSGVADAATATMDFELDIDDRDTEAAGGDASAPITDELEFDLDSDGLGEGLASADAGEEAEAAAADAEDDLDFDLDIDLDATAIGEADSLDAEPDTDAQEESVVSEAAADFEETQELDLADMDSLLDLGHAGSETSADGGHAEDLDLDLDLTSGDTMADDMAAGTEATEEFDLAEIEEMIEKAEDMPPAQDSEEADADFELELELDSTYDSAEEKAEGPAAADDEPGGDLDLSGLDDLLDERPAASPAGEVEETGDAEEAGSLDLDDLLDLRDAEAATDASEDAVEEIDPEVDIAAVADDAATPAPETALEEIPEDAGYDLSDQGEPLELAQEPAGGAPDAEDDDLEFAIDEQQMDPSDAEAAGEDVGQAERGVEETAMVDAEAQTEELAVEGSAAAAAAFGLGAVSDDDDARSAASRFDSGPGEEAPPQARAKKKSGGLVRAAVTVVLLAAVGLGALFGARYFGIEVPYLDKLKGLNIPVVSDLLGPTRDAAGNLKIAIDEKDVNGRFVANEKVGTLYVVSGRIKNEYDDPRDSIRITGKIYAKGRKLALEKSVYAGNVLSESELGVLNRKDIDQKLQNRLGQNEKNINVKKGGTLPFMIVFSNLPKNPDEYTVEVASSRKVK